MTRLALGAWNGALRLGVDADRVLPPMRARLKIQPDSESENRRLLQETEGKVSIPYLYDPNTELGLFESADILEYLQDTYSA